MLNQLDVRKSSSNGGDPNEDRPVLNALASFKIESERVPGQPPLSGVAARVAKQKAYN